MKKSLGTKTAVFPMPVLMVGTYDEHGVADVMNAAWGMICGMDRITLCLSESHKTFKNIKKTGAFTVALADRAHVREADYFGIASANNAPDKFAKSRLTAVRSENVNAPVIEEFPLTLECELIECGKYGVVGRIVNVLAEEKYINTAGKFDAVAAGVMLFDQFSGSYLVAGEKVARAWSAGKELMK